METTREAFEGLKKIPFHRFKVLSDSMHPVIKTGDDIYIAVGEENLKRFDIIVFFQNGMLICHYLSSFKRDGDNFHFQTRNFRGHNDRPFEKGDYLGKVLSHRLGIWDKVKAMLR